MIVYIQRIGWIVGLVLLQALVLNRIHICGYATPFLYIYFILKYRSGVGRNTLMGWAFALGLLVDIFSNTPGVNAASLTLLAFLRGNLLRLVTLRDPDDDFCPGIQSMGFSVFFRYLLFSCTLFCAVLLLVETFSFANIGRLLLQLLTDTLATIVCILCVEGIGKRR